MAEAARSTAVGDSDYDGPTLKPGSVAIESLGIDLVHKLKNCARVCTIWKFEVMLQRKTAPSASLGSGVAFAAPTAGTMFAGLTHNEQVAKFRRNCGGDLRRGVRSVRLPAPAGAGSCVRCQPAAQLYFTVGGTMYL